MSLMKTLAKVAIGVAAAKGIGHMVKKGRAGQSGDGGLFGGAHSPDRQVPSDRGGLEDMLGDILGGKGQARSGKGADGGLGGLLESLTGGTGGQQRAGTGGGLDDMLGQILGGGSARGGAGGGGLGGLGELLGGAGGGGLGGLMDALTGGGGSAAQKPGGSFGDLLNQAIQKRDEPEVPPAPQQEAAAALMLRAMIQAAKSDGKIDAHEREQLLGQLGDVSPEEKRFVDRELAAEIDVQGLARQVPAGLEPQVYAMSVMGIDLDNQNEAQYLHQLATAMNIPQRNVNQIHQQLGVPPLYG